jgi:hypothetical protein
MSSRNCVCGSGITHTPVESQHFYFQSSADIDSQLRGRKIDPQGSHAAHSWKETAVKTFLKYFSVAHSWKVFSRL